MITALKLKENQLDELYDWVDGLPMSRTKKYIYQLAKKYQQGFLRWSSHGRSNPPFLSQNHLNPQLPSRKLL